MKKCSVCGLSPGTIESGSSAYSTLGPGDDRCIECNSQFDNYSRRLKVEQASSEADRILTAIHPGVAAGGSLSLVLHSDGSLSMKGVAKYSVAARSSHCVAVSASAFHGLILLSDTSIAAVGTNANGECDIPEPNHGFVSVAAGEFHSLGLLSSGAVAAWGWNYSGQCTVPSPNASFIAIAAGSEHSLGLKADGSVVAWGKKNNGRCQLPKGVGPFISIAAGKAHSLGLRPDGSVVAWGADNRRQCQIPVGCVDVISIAAGDSHSLALKSDGSIVAWGCNRNHKCDIPGTNANFIAVGAGRDHSIALKANGEVVAWGGNVWQQCSAPLVQLVTGRANIDEAAPVCAAMEIAPYGSIDEYLNSIELSQYRECFSNHDIEFSMLPALSTDDLREIGIESLGHRKKILAGLNRATTSGMPNAAVLPTSPATLVRKTDGTARNYIASDAESIRPNVFAVIFAIAMTAGVLMPWVELSGQMSALGQSYNYSTGKVLGISTGYGVTGLCLGLAGIALAVKRSRFALLVGLCAFLDALVFVSGFSQGRIDAHTSDFNYSGGLKPLFGLFLFGGAALMYALSVIGHFGGRRNSGD